LKLLIDAGNTRIKWALVETGVWLQTDTLPIEHADNLAHFFGRHFTNLGLDSRKIKIYASNVAGEKIEQHIRRITTGHPPDFVVARKNQCGVHNRYTKPSQLGSDRWCALIAAWNLMRGGCLVVNCGTATTVDRLSAQGEFLGGLILPGLELMQHSLHDATAQLRSMQGKYVPLPLNTADALFSGAIQASCGAIERQYTLCETGSAPVLLSGGAAIQLHAHVNLPTQIVDNLVLQGLLLIAGEAGA